LSASLESTQNSAPDAVGGRYGQVLVGLAFVLTSAVAFGITPSLVTSLRGDVSILQLVTMRALFAAVILFAVSGGTMAWAARRAPNPRRPGRAKPQPLRWLIGIPLGICFLGPDVLIFYASFEYLDTSVALALSYVYPAIVVVIIALTTWRFPARIDVLLSMVALVGVVAVIDPTGAGTAQWQGVLMVLTCASLYATYTVLASGLSSSLGAFLLGAQVMVGVFAMGVVATLVSDARLLPADGRSWLVVTANALLLVVAIVAHYSGLRRLGPTRAALADTTQPIVGVVAGAAVLGERLTVTQLIGVAVIVLAVAAGSLLSRFRENAELVDPR
jgi:drug/metabolite transporter (DMT)-like permease